MPSGGLTGARIRRRRLDRGVKQADLARACGISPSYLNLIEHDRRKIGGKLLADIAEALDVTPERLRIGADAQEIATLRAAAADTPEVAAELDAAEDFAARFPGWAGLVAEQARRIAVLQRTVELMGDRMTHDPQLAASLHNILSTVTAIRATSAILAGDDPVEPGWQQRFHRNLYEDSRRLAEATEALVVDLDADAAAETGTTPLDQMEEWLGGGSRRPGAGPGRGGGPSRGRRGGAALGARARTGPTRDRAARRRCPRDARRDPARGDRRAPRGGLSKARGAARDGGRTGDLRRIGHAYPPPPDSGLPRAAVRRGLPGLRRARPDRSPGLGDSGAGWQRSGDVPRLGDCRDPASGRLRRGAGHRGDDARLAGGRRVRRGFAGADGRRLLPCLSSRKLRRPARIVDPRCGSLTGAARCRFSSARNSFGGLRRRSGGQEPPSRPLTRLLPSAIVAKHWLFVIQGRGGRWADGCSSSRTSRISSRRSASSCPATDGRWTPIPTGVPRSRPSRGGGPTSSCSTSCCRTARATISSPTSAPTPKPGPFRC